VSTEPLDSEPSLETPTYSSGSLSALVGEGRWSSRTSRCTSRLLTQPESGPGHFQEQLGNTHDDHLRVAVLDPECVRRQGDEIALLPAADWFIAFERAPTTSGVDALLTSVWLGPDAASFRSLTNPFFVAGLSPAHCSVLATVIHALWDHLRDLPCVLLIAILRMMAGIVLSTGPHTFAAACGLSRRGLERRLASAGLAPPWTVIAAARLVQAYEDLANPLLSFSRIAHTHGFGRLSVLRRQTLAATGAGLDQIRRSSRQAFAERIAIAMVRGTASGPTLCG